VAREKDLLQKIASAPTLMAKQEIGTKLAFFYLFMMREPSKALALIPQIEPRFRYGIRVQAIDYNQKITPGEKVTQYRALLKDFPENRDDLQFLISARQREQEQLNAQAK
jgi:hypothetical protein